MCMLSILGRASDYLGPYLKEKQKKRKKAARVGSFFAYSTYSIDEPPVTIQQASEAAVSAPT